jgi:hypothetical protein
VLSIATRLRLFWLLHFSKSPIDRLIYRAIHRGKLTKITEVGVGLGQRALRMIEIARMHAPADQVRYVGVDPFEGRTEADGPGLSLKEAYQLFRTTGIKSRLLPGDPFTALSHGANIVGPADLVIVSRSVESRAMARAWFYLPRMLHNTSRVLIEEVRGGQVILRELSIARVRELAGARPLTAASSAESHRAA